MHYHLTADELTRMRSALIAAVSIPFLDGIEDYIVEAIWEHTKQINGPDPFYHTRSKDLYDVVDTQAHIGWSVKSIQKAFQPGKDFEVVIQRADVFKKADKLGFPGLNAASDPNLIGEAVLKHWNQKVTGDAVKQQVEFKRILVLLKTNNKLRYAIYEDDLHQYSPDELHWKWTTDGRFGLQGIRKLDNWQVYRWYQSGNQLFERFVLPEDAQMFDIVPQRLGKGDLIKILLPHLQEQEECEQLAAP